MTRQQTAETLLAGVRNFRDVGGLPTGGGLRVRTGTLFRSGHLAHATEADRDFLGALGLHTIFDFRNAADHALEGRDVTLPGVRNVNIPLSDPEHGEDFWRLVREGSLAELRAALPDGEAEASMRSTYRTMVRTRTAEHGRVLRALADGQVPALLHCAAGKDRAGVTVAITLLALGVERQAILADYLESNAPHRRYPVWRRPDEDEADGAAAEATRLLAPLFDARAEYLQAAFDEIDTGWGGVEPYLADGLGLTEADRAQLRGRLLTGG